MVMSSTSATRRPRPATLPQRDGVDAAAPSPEPTASQILLSNITANPDSSPCFTYQTALVNINGTNTTW
jgi:hypothetical protein